MLNDCSVQTKFVYELPDGFTVINELDDNGFLSLTDSNNNALEVEIMLASLNIALPESEAIGKEVYEDGSYRLNFDNMSLIDNFNSIVVIPNENFIIYVYFHEDGKPQTRAAFEEKAMQLVRSITPEGENKDVWKKCVDDDAYVTDRRWFGKG